MPHAGASLNLSRYSVVIPAGTVGPVAVTAAVYYQSVEAVVSYEVLGNLADVDMDHTIEPCVLGGACDGRTPTTEPAVVEGAPPVPMEVASWVIEVDPDVTEPAPTFMYPAMGVTDAYSDVVVKVGFSEPVVGINASTFTLTDGGGLPVSADVDQISDGVWALFPHDIFLPNDTYTATVSAPICDVYNNCWTQDVTWSFTTTSAGGTGDTSVPLGFGGGGTPPGMCGDGVCDTTPGSGEDCLTCPADCNGVQGGNPGNRFCCGDGGGQNPVDCTDPRCYEPGWACI
jgi:hypothetical protein